MIPVPISSTEQKRIPVHTGTLFILFSRNNKKLQNSWVFSIAPPNNTHFIYTVDMTIIINYTITIPIKTKTTTKNITKPGLLSDNPNTNSHLGACRRLFVNILLHAVRLTRITLTPVINCNCTDHADYFQEFYFRFVTFTFSKRNDQFSGITINYHSILSNKKDLHLPLIRSNFNILN